MGSREVGRGMPELGLGIPEDCSIVDGGGSEPCNCWWSRDEKGVELEARLSRRT